MIDREVVSKNFEIINKIAYHSKIVISNFSFVIQDIELNQKKEDRSVDFR